MTQDLSIPVIAIDGGAGTGKGTVRIILCDRLGFHGLDSGVLYRLVALISVRKGVSDEQGFVEIANNLEFRMDGESIFIDDEDVSNKIRTPEIDKLSAHVSQIPGVRQGVFNFQIGMRKAPGLVADGRDMGDIFDTPHRFFLTADPAERARRRVLQSAERNITVDYQSVLDDILKRDHADRTRSVSPLAPHKDARIIDTTKISAEMVVNVIMFYYDSMRIPELIR